MSRDATLNLNLDEIVVGDRRPVSEDAVKRLAQSIRQIGLQHPITVRSVRGAWVLVAGRHRLEACRRLNLSTITASVARLDEIDAEMWEISENLHRAELTALERSEQIDRWRQLCLQKKVAQDGPPGGDQPSEQGVRETSRELGLSRQDVERSKTVASLSDEAKEAAREAGLDDNRSALLEAAKAAPEQQAAVIRDIAEHRASERSKIDADVKVRAAREVASMLAEHVPGEWWDALKANLYAAGAANIAHELTNITGQSIMDRRYGE